MRVGVDKRRPRGDCGGHDCLRSRKSGVGMGVGEVLVDGGADGGAPSGYSLRLLILVLGGGEGLEESL